MLVTHCSPMKARIICIHVVLSLLTLVASGAVRDKAAHQSAGDFAVPSQRAEREAIIAAANSAIHKYMRAGKRQGDSQEIPRKFWGDAITRLNPVKVVNDRVNVFIVLREDQLAAGGLYVSIPISSYAPGHDERFLRFKGLTGPNDKALGRIHQCVIKKPKEPATDSKPTGKKNPKPEPEGGSQ
mgnify:CR=1 FL=1